MGVISRELQQHWPEVAASPATSTLWNPAAMMKTVCSAMPANGMCCASWVVIITKPCSLFVKTND